MRWFTLIFLATALGYAQSDVELQPGVILVASRDLRDRVFAQSVIVIATDDDDGTMGIMLNRQASLPLNRALDWPEAKGRTEPAFLGGPIETGEALAILRSAAAPARAVHVFKDIYAAADGRLVRLKLADGVGPDQFRLFLGYTGWGPGQLDTEIEDGVWIALPPNPELIFDPDPATLWDRLTRLIETQLALDMKGRKSGSEGRAAGD